MINNKYGVMFFISVLGLVGVITVSANIHTTVFASHEFAANLTGQEEVPPVNTEATGKAIFVPDLPNNETMSFYVNFTSIEGVTQGHIHSGSQGENGEVVVTLFNYDSPQGAVTENGTFTSSNLEGPMQGKTIGDLMIAMENGTTYVNIHTEQNPEGEIRGQLMDIE